MIQSLAPSPAFISSCSYCAGNAWLFMNLLAFVESSLLIQPISMLLRAVLEVLGPRGCRVLCKQALDSCFRCCIRATPHSMGVGNTLLMICLCSHSSWRWSFQALFFAPAYKCAAARLKHWSRTKSVLMKWYPATPPITQEQPHWWIQLLSFVLRVICRCRRSRMAAAPLGRRCI